MIEVPPLDPSWVRQRCHKMYRRDYHSGFFFLALVSGFGWVIATIGCMIPDDEGNRWWPVWWFAAVPLISFAVACVIHSLGRDASFLVSKGIGVPLDRAAEQWRTFPPADRKLARPVLDAAYAAARRGDQNGVQLRCDAVAELHQELTRRIEEVHADTSDLDPLRARVEAMKLDNDSTERARRIYEGGVIDQ